MMLGSPAKALPIPITRALLTPGWRRPHRARDASHPESAKRRRHLGKETIQSSTLRETGAGFACKALGWCFSTLATGRCLDFNSQGSPVSTDGSISEPCFEAYLAQPGTLQMCKDCQCFQWPAGMRKSF